MLTLPAHPISLYSSHIKNGHHHHGLLQGLLGHLLPPAGRVSASRMFDLLRAHQHLFDHPRMDSWYISARPMSCLLTTHPTGVVHAFCVISDCDIKTDGAYDEERAAAVNSRHATPQQNPSQPQVVVVAAEGETVDVKESGNVTVVSKEAST